MALTFEVLILAKNELDRGFRAANEDAKRGLAELENTGARANQALARQSLTLQQELAKTGQVVRIVAGDLTSALSPALGETVNALGAATSATRGMSLATGAMVASLAVVGVGLTQYVKYLTDAADKQAALNLAVRAFDTGTIRAQMTEAARAIEQGAERVKTFGALQGILEVFGKRAQPFVDWITGAAKGTEDLARARAALARVLPHERELALTEAYQKQSAALQTVVQAEIARAAELKNVGEFLRLHQQVRDAIEDEASLAREAARLRTQAAEGRAGITAQEVANLRERLQLELDLINTQTLARQRVLKQAEEQGRLSILSRRLPPISGTDLPAEGVAPTAAELAAMGAISSAILDKRLQQETELLAIRQEQADTALSIAGLSAREREQLEMTLTLTRAVSRERAADLAVERARERGDAVGVELAEGRRQVIRFEEAIRRSNLGQGAAERTDLFAGIAKGFREMTDELESFGRDGERIMRNFASSTHGFLSDLLFTPLEDDWKKALQDTPRRFLQSIGREITDAVAKMALGQLVKGAQGLFPSLVAAPVMAGAGVVVAAPGTAAGAAVLQAAQAGQALAPAAAGAPVGAGASGVSGLAGIGALWPSVLRFFQGGAGSAGSAALADPALAAALGIAPGTPIATANLAALGTPEVASGLGIIAPSAAPSSLGSLSALIGPSLGALGGAVGLGFTLYGALQGPPTAQNIITSSVSGAVSGAVLATSLVALAQAGVFGASLAAAPFSFGTSLIVGAIVGAALGAGAGALGKGGTGITAAGRTEARANIGHRTYDEIVQALNGGKKLRETAETVIHTGNTVGGLLRRIAEYNLTGAVAGDPWQWAPDRDLAQPVIDSLAALGIASEEFSEGGGNGRGGVGSVGELIASFGGAENPQGGAQRAAELLRGWLDVVADVERAAADFASELQAAGGRTPFAFLESRTWAGVGRVGTQTFLPASQLFEPGQGGRGERDVFISVDAFRNMPPAVALALWTRLKEIDRDLNVGIVDRYRFSGGLF